MHLRRRALEQPSAASRKQRVAAEQQRLPASGPAEIGDMAGGVAGHVEHRKVQVELGQGDAVAFGQAHVAVRQAFPRRAVHCGRRVPRKFEHTADMVAVMMGEYNGAQLQPAPRQQLEHRAGFARVHHGNRAIAHNGPYIVVGKGWQRRYSTVAARGRHGLHHFRNVDLSEETPPIVELAEWFQTPPGEYVLAWERAQFDAMVADVFGYYAWQAGLSEINLLRANRMPFKGWVGSQMPTPEQAAQWQGCVVARPDALPFESQSADLLVLPHAFECTDAPHEV